MFPFHTTFPHLTLITVTYIHRLQGSKCAEVLFQVLLLYMCRLWKEFRSWNRPRAELWMKAHLYNTWHWCLFPQFSVRVHDIKPNTNQLKVSVSACDVVAVTQLSVQEVEVSWSSGLGGKPRQLMAERVQRLQREKDKKRYLIYGWEDYPVEEIIIQIHLDSWNVGDVWPPIWRRTSHPFAVMWL